MDLRFISGQNQGFDNNFPAQNHKIPAKLEEQYWCV
jgi:hypothetical protein